MFGSQLALGTIVGGNISVDTTWVVGGNPYIVMENVIVDPGITLTIDPGVQVKFDPPGVHGYLNIFVEGTLISVGQTGLLVNFTSNGGSPVNDWGQIQVNNTGTAEVRNSTFSHGYGIVLSSASTHNITQNSFSWYAGVETRTPGHNITNNMFSNNGHIDLVSSNNSVSQNDIQGEGIAVWSPGNLIIGNDVDGSGAVSRLIGVYSTGNMVSGNRVTDDGDDTGIEVSGEGNIISENSVSGAKQGIDVTSFDNVTVVGNVLTNCSIGIETSLTDGHELLRNNVTGGSFGILLAASNWNLVVGNEISMATSYGISVRGSAGNRIYHNVLLYNGVQAEDDRTSNAWDDGYPSGGNYWSDYGGNDTKGGPLQDIPGSDGIGDTPYSIATNRTDRYPLTEPTLGNLPPRDLDAYLSGWDYENVTIAWNISWNDGQRANDVSGYEIYRAVTYDKDRIGYSLLGSTPNQTREFVDVSSGEGDPSNYFYYVCAVNGTGNLSCSAGQVGKYTKTLLMGPNLASIPLVQLNDDIEKVLQTVSFDMAWSYDSQIQEWTSYVKTKPYSKGLRRLNHTMGFWVNVTAASNLTVAGKVSKEVHIRLAPGWNLIGFPSFTTISLGDMQQDAPILRGEAFDPVGDPYHLLHMMESETMLPGEGFWLLSSSEGMVTLRN